MNKITISKNFHIPLKKDIVFPIRVEYCADLTLRGMPRDLRKARATFWSNRAMVKFIKKTEAFFLLYDACVTRKIYQLACGRDVDGIYEAAYLISHEKIKVEKS